MSLHSIALKIILVFGLAFGVSTMAYSCDEHAHDSVEHSEMKTGEKTSAKPDAALVVHKSSTCGCCGGWVDHINKAGYLTSIVEDGDINSVKNRFDIAPQARSCHTAVYNDKYVFEGHVPPSAMARFLESPPPGAKGLVVPGMPVGSPGMEDGERFQSYKVWLLSESGEFSEYAQMNSYQDQF
jgi:hypothetical protein